MGIFEDLYRSLTGQAPNPVPAADGIRTVKVIEAALESAANGKIIQL